MDQPSCYRAMERAYRERETVLSGVMDDRAERERATARQRHLAIAADAEPRRRHPGQVFEPLRSAEPEPVTEADSSELNLTPGQPIPEMGQWIKELAAARTAFAGRLAERQSQAISHQNPDHGHLGQAFPSWEGPSRDAILQPPTPQIPASARVLQRMWQRETEMETAN